MVLENPLIKETLLAFFLITRRLNLAARKRPSPTKKLWNDYHNFFDSKKMNLIVSFYGSFNYFGFLNGNIS